MKFTILSSIFNRLFPWLGSYGRAPRLRVKIATAIWRDFDLSNAAARCKFLRFLYDTQYPRGDEVMHRLLPYLEPSAHGSAIDPRPQKYFFIVAESAELASLALCTEAFRRELAQAERDIASERVPGQYRYAGPQLDIILCYPPEGVAVEPLPPQDKHYTAAEKCGRCHTFGPQVMQEHFEHLHHARMVAKSASRDK